MKEKILRLKEISEIVEVPINTVRTYLGSYRFTKFVVEGERQVYKFNAKFVEEFAEYLYMKRKYRAIDLLHKYCGEGVLIC